MKTKKIIAISMTLFFTAFSDGYAGGNKQGNKQNPPPGKEQAEKPGAGGNKPTSQCRDDDKPDDTCKGSGKAKFSICPGKPPNRIGCL